MNTHELIERTRVLDTLIQLFVATDQREWPAVEACFADSVLFDMTSLAGGEPARLTPAQISAAWAEGLAPIEALHHQVGNFQVQIAGERALASCYGVAWHYRRVASGRNTRTFVGSYDFQLARTDAGGWQIEHFRFLCKFVEGNLGLDQEAAAS
jgi:hypothetical protein